MLLNINQVLDLETEQDPGLLDLGNLSAQPPRLSLSSKRRIRTVANPGREDRAESWEE